MATQQAAYDLVLKGGTLMDPAQNINDRRDVAFKDGKVAAVSQRIDPRSAAQVVDVTGKLVTPGFIDLHGHFYNGSAMCVDADKFCLSGGVTTAVDAGSAGWTNYRTMRDYIVPTKVTRLLAFLHIGASGLLLNQVVGGELQDIRHADPDRAADAIKENPGYLVGVKVRMQLNAVSHWERRSAMRFLLKATMPIEAGNALSKDPSMEHKMEAIMGDLKPESVFFCLEGGQRTIYFEITVDDSSRLPSIAEPLWHTFKADIEMIPAMNQEEFGKAMESLGTVMAKY